MVRTAYWCARLHERPAYRGRVKRIAYPDELPISRRVDEIRAAIEAHQVVIVAGETGSGKSTQLPKICLDLGRGAPGKLIGHTQPRRLAARTVAERVAEELGTRLGGEVGYTVRFTDQVGPATRVKVMTDGILLAETQRDRRFDRYDTLIIDEAHERSLNVDFLLGYCTQLLPQRPDLKLIITSATIDTERFARHFDAPIIEVSGRTYPVELRYQPLEGDADRPDRDQATGICDAVEELMRAGPGDILVFCSGEREIREAAEALADRSLAGLDVLQLYARLSAAEQHRVFAAHDRRRVVLATNVAETSLTVPGVRFVVDAGTARISRFSRRTKVQRLPIEPVSQASANQRAGRCGRVAPGICIRLYDEDDFDARPDFTEPEIMRTNLASVILTMATLRLGDVTDFPFVDPPPSRSVTDGIALLEELGALDPANVGTRRWVTPVGRKLARLPVDPRFGRMVLAGDELGCAREVMVLAAAMSLQDPRERPAEHQEAAAEQHARFADPSSDFMSLLNLWEYVREQQRADSGNQFRRRCKREFLNQRRVREWQDINRQLRQMAGSVGIRPNRTSADADLIHRAVLAGLLSHVGLHEGTRRDYRGARNSRFVLARDSSLAKRPPRWVMAAELVETNQVWARLAAGIRPEWADEAGQHLVKRSHGDPRWEPEQAQAMVDERVTLYGLPIVPARAVPYARVDPADARAMFLQHGLAEGEWLDEGSEHHAFAVRNEELLAEIEAAEARMRRGLLTEHDPLLGFYDARVGAEVTSGPRFNRWWKTARRTDPQLLDARLEDLVEPARLEDGATEHPDLWVMDDMELRLSYRHDPAADDDGVTVHVPVGLLNQLRQAPFDWQVPGLREALVVSLIRSLPKSIRQAVNPVADRAREFLDDHGPDDGPLLPLLAARLMPRAGVPVGEADFDLDRVPDHLRVTFAAENDRGTVMGRSKSVVALKSHLRDAMTAAVGEGSRHLERSGCRSWEFGTIPRVVGGSGATRGHPALVDEGESVGLRILPTRIEQLRSMSAATRRLVQLVVAPPARTFRGGFGDGLSLTEMPHGGIGALFQDSWDCAVGRLIADHGGLVWDEAAFTDLVEAARRELPSTMEAMAGELDRIFIGCRRVRRALNELTAPALAPTAADVRTQLDRLVYPGFVTATGTERLPDLQRYLDAMVMRLERARADVGRDLRLLGPVAALEVEFHELAESRAGRVAAAEMQRLRWDLEELRVSVFAQTIGTRGTVSEPRIRTAMATIAESRPG
jgi:ATP-dependent helicase HrpA